MSRPRTYVYTSCIPFFVGDNIWTDLKKVSGLWYHDGGKLSTSYWTANAEIGGDGVCMELLYIEDRIVFNDLDCTEHLRKYICEYVAT